MKAFFSLSVLLLMSFWVYSQDCEYEVDKQDKFSGSIIKVIKPVTIAEKLKVGKDLKFVKIAWSMKQDDNKLFVLLEWRFAKGYVSMNGLAGSSLSVLLENGEVLELKMTTPLSNTIKRGSKYYAQSEFILTTEDFIKLSLYKVSDIKVNAMINPFEFPVDSEVQPIILEKTKCFTLLPIEKEEKPSKKI